VVVVVEELEAGMDKLILQVLQELREQVVVEEEERLERLEVKEAQDPLLSLFICNYHYNIRMICVYILISYKS
jgi:hypothetical protein